MNTVKTIARALIVALATMVEDAVPRNKKMTSTTRQIVMTRVRLT